MKPLRISTCLLGGLLLTADRIAGRRHTLATVLVERDRRGDEVGARGLEGHRHRGERGNRLAKNSYVPSTASASVT